MISHHRNQGPPRAHWWSRSSRRRVALAALAVVPLVGLVSGSASGDTVAPTPEVSTVTVKAGAGDQNDPHLSGSLVSYTQRLSSAWEIRYQNLATGADAAIPNGGNRDLLSDVSGTTIVFARVYLGSSEARPIMFFDTATPDVAPVELDPRPELRRSSPAIGGRTVAWVEAVGESRSLSEVVVYDLDTQVATALSTDGDRINRNPAVSADGSVVTWTKCDSTGLSCDVYVATKVGGAWAARALTGSEGEDVLPVSNGEVVVYATNAGGDFDIAWKSVDGAREGTLPLPEGREIRPNIDGHLVSFDQYDPGSSRSDLWLYDMASDTTYRLTDTPAVDEVLNDISVGPDGMVHIAWAQPDGLSFGDRDVFAMSFRLDANRAPDCSGVSPGASRLWPPDHKLEPVSLGGAVDPDGDPVTLAVTLVTQDEPVDGVDDGATAPDAQLGPASDQVLVRAERNGAGDGRVYRVAFTATDTGGASCHGVVTVGVPLVRDGAVTDSGGVYDSLTP